MTLTTNATIMKNANATTTKTAAKKTAAPVSNAKSATTVKKEQLKAENVKQAANAVAEKDSAIYIYPKEVKSKADKKNFRRQARAALESFKKRIAKAEEAKDKTALKTVTTEFTAWKQKTLSESHSLMKG